MGKLFEHYVKAPRPPPTQPNTEHSTFPKTIHRRRAVVRAPIRRCALPAASPLPPPPGDQRHAGAGGRRADGRTDGSNVGSNDTELT